MTFRSLLDSIKTRPLLQTIRVPLSNIFHNLYRSKLNEFAEKMPSSVTIVIESKCNLSCRMCIYHSKEISRPRTDFSLTFEEFKREYEILSAIGLKSYHLCAVGEPFLNKDIFKMIRFLKHHGHYTSVLTNGSSIITPKIEDIVDSGLDLYKIDIDHSDSSKLEFIKRGIREKDLFLNIAEIKRMSELKNHKITIMADCIVMNSNIEHLTKIVDKCKNNGISQLNLSYLIPYAKGHEIVSDLNNVVNYRSKEVMKHVRNVIEYGKKVGVVVSDPFDAYNNSESRRCMAPWNKIMLNVPSPYIDKKNWLGNVSMSCKLCFSEYGRTFGNIFADNFDDVWNGEKIRDIRRRLLTGKDVPLACAKLCPYYYNAKATIDPNYSNKLDFYIAGDY